MRKKELSIVEKFNRYMKSHNISSVVVAFSGGVDSTLLLYLSLLWSQSNKNTSLRALHIDHDGSFTGGDSYVKHCKSWCKNYNIKLSVIKARIKHVGGKSLEQSSRESRYMAFTENIIKGESLLLAHHLDDQIETFLQRLQRSAGIRGLRAMPQKREIGDTFLYRPLLEISRCEIEKQARAMQLNWVNDLTNMNTNYDRNYLRHMILPQLNKRWPETSKRWSQSIKLLDKQYKALQWHSREQLNKLLIDERRVDISKLKKLPRYVVEELLNHWFLSLNIDLPGATQLNEIVEQLIDTSCPPTAAVTIPQTNSTRRVTLRCYREILFIFIDNGLDIELKKIYFWNPEEPLHLPHGILIAKMGKGGIKPPKNGWQVCFKNSIPNKTIKPVGKKHSISFKNLFQQNSIPPWERDTLPMICLDKELLAIADICIDKKAVVSSKSQGFIISWQR